MYNVQYTRLCKSQQQIIISMVRAWLPFYDIYSHPVARHLFFLSNAVEDNFPTTNRDRETPRSLHPEIGHI